MRLELEITQNDGDRRGAIYSGRIATLNHAKGERKPGVDLPDAPER